MAIATASKVSKAISRRTHHFAVIEARRRTKFDRSEDMLYKRYTNRTEVDIELCCPHGSPDDRDELFEDIENIRPKRFSYDENIEFFPDRRRYYNYQLYNEYPGEPIDLPTDYLPF